MAGCGDGGGSVAGVECPYKRMNRICYGSVERQEWELYGVRKREER